MQLRRNFSESSVLGTSVVVCLTLDRVSVTVISSLLSLVFYFSDLHTRGPWIELTDWVELIASRETLMAKGLIFVPM